MGGGRYACQVLDGLSAVVVAAAAAVEVLVRGAAPARGDGAWVSEIARSEWGCWWAGAFLRGGREEERDCCFRCLH